MSTIKRVRVVVELFVSGKKKIILERYVFMKMTIIFFKTRKDDFEITWFI